VRQEEDENCKIVGYLLREVNFMSHKLEIGLSFFDEFMEVSGFF
jgi:hypothetical protein